MARGRSPYPPEFRRQRVELVRAGRGPEELAREFDPTASHRLRLILPLPSRSQSMEIRSFRASVMKKSVRGIAPLS